jgi:hypothetical protein
LTDILLDETVEGFLELVDELELRVVATGFL